MSPGVCTWLLFHSCDSGSNQLGPIYGHTSVMTGSLLDDHHWHAVVIERQGRSINLTLDRSWKVSSMHQLHDTSTSPKGVVQG